VPGAAAHSLELKVAYGVAGFQFPGRSSSSFVTGCCATRPKARQLKECQFDALAIPTLTASYCMSRNIRRAVLLASTACGSLDRRACI
jgi:hypothetical protein